MVLTSGLSVFVIGLAGGVATEVLHWWNLRENPNLPIYATRPFYWIITAAMILLGGGLAWLQLGDNADALITFQIGLAAPMLLQKLIKSAPEKPGAMGSQASVRDFLGA